MQHIFIKLKEIFRRELVLLWIFNVLAGLALVVLQNKNKLPLGKGDFVFLFILALLVALWKPRWIFFLFVGAVPLESIILTSGFLPIQLRPYQFLGGILVIAVAILYFSKKLRLDILKPVWLDWLVFALVPFSFLNAIHSSAKNITFKNNLILLSFAVLYYLVRNFVRNREDVAKTAFFFLGSYIIVAIYGFWQVFADKFGARSFEVMFGRPNATFAEPDWLGIFLSFSLAVFLSLMFFFLRDRKKFFLPVKYILLLLDIFVFLNITLIILALSRSAWIGAMTIFIFYFIVMTPTHKSAIAKMCVGDGWDKFFREVIIIFIIFIISAGVIRFGKLSKFDLSDRARSAATSEQKITIACEDNRDIPDVVANVNELEKYGCRHINLEEISRYKLEGKFVTEIFRQDPNILTRKEIYQKGFGIIKQHPILGVGFGTITQALGADERGAGLNESNIFLQIWAGCGILGLIAFIAIFVYLFIYSFRRVSPICPMNKFFGCPITKDSFEKTLHVFAVLGIIALIVPNLLNAGLFMGIFWLGLGTMVSIIGINKQ